MCFMNTCDISTMATRRAEAPHKWADARIVLCDKNSRGTPIYTHLNIYSTYFLFQFKRFQGDKGLEFVSCEVSMTYRIFADPFRQFDLKSSIVYHMNLCKNPSSRGRVEVIHTNIYILVI